MLRGQPVKNSSAGVTTTLWLRCQQAGFGNDWGAVTADMMDFFTDKFGPAPFPSLTVVETVDGAPNGYAGPGLVFLAPLVVTKEVNVNVLSNQIARQWWEEEVSPVNRNHLWLENGMALYSEALWTEKDKGAAALEQRMRDTDITARSLSTTFR